MRDRALLLLGDRGCPMMPSLDGHALARAIDACYEASLDPELWPSVLDAIGEAAACTGAVLFKYGGADRSSYIASANCAGSMDCYLASEWPAKNPRFIIPPGQRTTSDVDFMHDEHIARCNTAFRDDFLRKFDMGWFAGAALLQHDGLQVLISVERNFIHEPFHPDELRQLDENFINLRKVMSLAPAMDARLRQALVDGFEGRAQAAAIIGPDRTVLHLNAAAERILPKVLRQRHGRLHAADARDEAAWAALIDRLVSGLRIAERCGEPVLLTSSCGSQILVRGMPLPRSASLLFPSAAALVFFQDLAPAAPDPEALRAAFGLTWAEARLASALAEHCDLGRAGRAMGIAHETARSHLKAVFAKTGSANQVACVAKLLRMR